MARVEVIRYEIASEERIKFAEAIKSRLAVFPRTAGLVILVLKWTHSCLRFLFASRLSNYPFVKHIPIMRNVSSPDSFAFFPSRPCQHTSTHCGPKLAKNVYAYANKREAREKPKITKIRCFFRGMTRKFSNYKMLNCQLGSPASAQCRCFCWRGP